MEKKSISQYTSQCEPITCFLLKRAKKMQANLNLSALSLQIVEEVKSEMKVVQEDYYEFGFNFSPLMKLIWKQCLLYTLFGQYVYVLKPKLWDCPNKYCFLFRICQSTMQYSGDSGVDGTFHCFKGFLQICTLKPCKKFQNSLL